MNQQNSIHSLNNQLAALLKFNPVDDNNLGLIEQLKSYLATSDNYLAEEFTSGTNVRKLVQLKSRHIDKMLVALWDFFELNLSPETEQPQSAAKLSLIAVGGYGRGELHPYSDIDLLILSDKKLNNRQVKSIESLIALLWDCHLKIGQSVRELNQCIQLASEDATIITSIMESRLIIGDAELFKQLTEQTAPDKMWSANDFFIAKTAEQKARYRKYDSSSFDLEPNLKSSPGGLRDIQSLSWISQRIYYPKNLYQLVRDKTISKKEYYDLVKCQIYLWRVRFALHLVSGKAEDRLLFDYQKSIAQLMGFKDCENSLAVEKLMKLYYRSASIIRNISDILLQVSEQKISDETSSVEVTKIDDNFQIIKQRIDAINPNCFIKKPSLLLQVFCLVAENNKIIGISAQTLRAIRAARYKIDHAFRNRKENHELFIAFWHVLHTSSKAMFLMKRSGVLADYLVPFQRITGQMQYDMFHSYTVDEHTLFLLKNLSEFADPEKNDFFPLCSEIMQRQQSPEIIFLAGLFHDIGKGRGGDHSEIGSEEANKFCQSHHLSQQKTNQICWLVANHLLMSLIAQKRDISDPKVIKNFAELVVTQHNLDLLYILTVADIRATSNNLWNSWKDTLLKDLYLYTSHYLTDESTNIEQLWLSNQNQAKALLLEKGLHENAIDDLFNQLEPQYFSKRSPEAIAWQMAKILNKKQHKETIVGIKSTSRRSGSEVFVYTKDKENLFAALTATLNQKGLSIQAANIYTDKNGYCYDSFFVLNEQAKALDNKYSKQQIKQAIINNVANISKVNLVVQRRMPRQFKYFTVPTKVEFYNDEYTGLTRMELTTRDQSGLLAAVGQAFKSTATKLHDARITTLGEKVEDTFIISDRNNKPIKDEKQQACIRQEIQRHIVKQSSK